MFVFFSFKLSNYKRDSTEELIWSPARDKMGWILQQMCTNRKRGILRYCVCNLFLCFNVGFYICVSLWVKMQVSTGKKGRGKWMTEMCYDCMIAVPQGVELIGLFRDFMSGRILFNVQQRYEIK